MINLLRVLVVGGQPLPLQNDGVHGSEHDSPGPIAKHGSRPTEMYSEALVAARIGPVALHGTEGCDPAHELHASWRKVHMISATTSGASLLLLKVAKRTAATGSPRASRSPRCIHVARCNGVHGRSVQHAPWRRSSAPYRNDDHILRLRILEPPNA